MKKYVAIAPEGDYLDITPGKEYPIIEILSNCKTYGRLFSILDNTDFFLVCNEFKCAHLKDVGNWTIKEVE
jgi:hypothetical protein